MFKFSSSMAATINLKKKKKKKKKKKNVDCKFYDIILNDTILPDIFLAF